MTNTLLVTGASGHFGQRVLHHLLNTLHVAADHVIATTRRPAELAEWAALGVTVRSLDFEHTASMPGAFEGAQRLLLVSTDAVGKRLAQHEAVIETAREVGVAHVVYTSMPDPLTSLITFAPDHAGTEAALAASTLPGWTVLRNHWYFENLYMSMPRATASGQWFTAAGDGATAQIARNDLARAAAAALASEAQGKATYTVSGARAYTTSEMARLVSQAVDKPIQVIQVPVDDLVQSMVAHGVPEAVARLIGSIDANTAAGLMANVTADLQLLTGSEPQSFEEWLTDPSVRRALTGITA